MDGEIVLRVTQCACERWEEVLEAGSTDGGHVSEGEDVCCDLETTGLALYRILGVSGRVLGLTSVIASLKPFH